MKILFADQSTLDDLQLYPINSRGETGIFEIYNCTISSGGYKKIHEIFYQPTNNVEDIEERQQIIKYLERRDILAEINPEDISIIEAYLSSNHTPVWSYFKISWYFKAFLYRVLNPGHYQYCLINILKVLKLLQFLSALVNQSIDHESNYYKSIIQNIKRNLQMDFFKHFIKINPQKLSFFTIFKSDHLLLSVHKEELSELMNQVFLIDAFTTIARVSSEKGFTYPKFETCVNPILVVKGIFHPLVPNPITNDLEIEENKTICLTGPNMSGKTTLLKSIGVCAYLAHIGLPVPCSEMRLTPIRSIITNIENFDNVNLGYSYFYNELIRVKSAIERIRNYTDILWIADELFRGTNIKDAQDATTVIIDKIVKAKGIKIISTHLLEVTKNLLLPDRITFLCMGTGIKNEHPCFSYTIEEGISNVRLGMYYLKKEGIIDDLDDLINDSP